MNSGELGELARSNARIAERIRVLEGEVRERREEIARLTAQLRATAPCTRAEITPGVCASVKDFAQRGYSYREIAKQFGIGLTTVSLIVSGKYRTKRLEKA